MVNVVYATHKNTTLVIVFLYEPIFCWFRPDLDYPLIIIHTYN